MSFYGLPAPPSKEVGRRRLEADSHLTKQSFRNQVCASTNCDAVSEKSEERFVFLKEAHSTHRLDKFVATEPSRLALCTISGVECCRSSAGRSKTRSVDVTIGITNKLAYCFSTFFSSGESSQSANKSYE